MRSDKLQENIVLALQGKLVESKKHSNKYKIVYFLNTACRERRPETEEDIQNDWKEIEKEFDTDLAAYEYVMKDCLKIDDLDEIYEDDDAETEDEKIESIQNYFDYQDPSDGSILLISMEGPGISYDFGFEKPEIFDESLSLMEATKLSLQGKLQESWIKQEDFIQSIKNTFGKDCIVKSGNYWCTILYRDLYFIITCDYKNDVLKTKDYDTRKTHEQPIKENDIFSSMKLVRQNLDNIINKDVFVILVAGILKYSGDIIKGYYTGDKEITKIANEDLNEAKTYSTKTYAAEDCEYIKDIYGVDFEELELKVEQI